MASWPYNTATWLRLRVAHLSLEPACRSCREHGLLVMANTVDHVIPISSGGDPFPAHDGLVSYCAPCHSSKTARGSEAGAIKTNKPRKGCNADGSPLDPDHPWHEKSLRADQSGPASPLKSQLVSDFSDDGGPFG